MELLRSTQARPGKYRGPCVQVYKHQTKVQARGKCTHIKWRCQTHQAGCMCPCAHSGYCLHRLQKVGMSLPHCPPESSSAACARLACPLGAQTGMHPQASRTASLHKTTRLPSAFGINKSKTKSWKSNLGRQGVRAHSVHSMAALQLT